MDISNIDASLEYGRFFTGGWVKFMYFSLIVASLLPLITIFMIVITLTIGMNWDNDMIIALIGCNIFGIPLAVVFIYFIVRNDKLKKKITSYVEDAIEIKAASNTIDRICTLGQFFDGVKIQISFVIDKKRYVRTSGTTENEKKLRNGYHKIFSRYTDREINILYSPKHDQVLILKDVARIRAL